MCEVCKLGTMDMVRIYVIFFTAACSFFGVSQTTVTGYSCNFGRRVLLKRNDLTRCSIQSEKWIVVSGYGNHGRQRDNERGGGYFLAGARGTANGTAFELPQETLVTLSPGRLSFYLKIWQPDSSTLTVTVCERPRHITSSNSQWTGPHEMNFYCSAPRITFRANGAGEIAVDDLTITPIQGTTTPMTTTTRPQTTTTRPQTTMLPRGMTTVGTSDTTRYTQPTIPRFQATTPNQLTPTEDGTRAGPVSTATIGTEAEVTLRTESPKSTTSPNIQSLGLEEGGESSTNLRIIATSLSLTAAIFIIVLLAVHRKYRAAKRGGEDTSFPHLSNMGSAIRVIRNACVNWFHSNDANTINGSQTAPTSNATRPSPACASHLYASVRKAPDGQLELNPESDGRLSEQLGQWRCNGEDSTHSAEVEMVENELYESYEFN